MRMNRTRLFTSLILLGSLLLLASSKTTHLPTVDSDETLNMRISELLIPDRVFTIFGNLQNIYKKQASQVVDGKEVAFPVCSQNPPEAIFFIKGQHQIGGNNYARGGLVYDFEQIKYPRNLIDIEIYNNKLYYVREDGIIKVASLTQNSTKITDLQSFSTEEKKVAFGNFVLLPDASTSDKQGHGLFLTQNQVTIFDLDGTNFTFLSDLESMGNFTKAIPIQNLYFAVALGANGVKIFYVDLSTRMIKLAASFNENDFNLKKINVKDLTYDPVRKILFVLDHHSGVIPLQLKIEQASLTAKVTSSVIYHSQCNVVYYDSYVDELYLNCKQLYKYRIHKWPELALVTLPRQEISIREITSSGSTVALIGRNIFEIVSLERKLAVYQDKLLDKLILKSGQFISGNEHFLMTGNYEVLPPTLSCASSDRKDIGKHKVLFKVTAECSPSYFQKIGMDPATIQKEDKCVYTVYHKLKIWRAAALNVKIFMILGIIIGLLGLGILLWWGCSYLKLNSLKAYLRHYETLPEQKEESPYTQAPELKQSAVTVEMNPVQNSQGSKEGRHELNEEIDIPNDLHDIE